MLSVSNPPVITYTAPTHILRRFAQSRGVWLHGHEPMRQSTQHIIDSSRFAGMHLDLLTYVDLPVIPFWRYDLIVLEQGRSQPMAAMVTSIKRARWLSSAPLVVLARRITPEATIAGLKAGADSVVSFRSPESVLLAHWGAMLNRWKAASKFTNRAS
ncbi:MAG: hypothetical protein WAU00_13355 [Caldilinea sp.]